MFFNLTTLPTNGWMFIIVGDITKRISMAWFLTYEAELRLFNTAEYSQYYSSYSTITAF